MKIQKTVTVLSLSFLLLMSGCTTWWQKKNESTNKVDVVKQEVQKAKDALNENSKDKVKEIQSTASGVDYALSKVTNAQPAVVVAKELNDRTVSLVGVPNVDEMNKMKQMVDSLTSAVKEEQIRGRKMLSDKDKEINQIQEERDQLKQDLQDKNKALQKTAEDVAKKSDEYKETIDTVNSFFGLGGIIYGVKRFVTTCLIFILVFGLIFLILRILSNTNPIAKAAFMVFDMIGGVVIHAVKSMMPNSLSVAKIVDQSHLDTYKNTLSKIVDSIQDLKSKTEVSNKAYTLDELLDLLSKNMNDVDKNVIDEIKKDLRWK
jgi:hypothetical protein